MNKKRRTRRERIDSILAVRDFTRLESAFQYLKGAQVYMSVSTQIGLVTLANFLLGTLVKFGFAKYFKLEFFIFYLYFVIFRMSPVNPVPVSTSRSRWDSAATAGSRDSSKDTNQFKTFR